MATYVCTIGGDAVTFQIDSLDIAQVMLGHDTIVGDIASLDGSYDPEIGDEIIVTENGTRIFGGTLQMVDTGGMRDQPIVAKRHTVEAVAFSALMERSLYTGTLAAGSLESQLLTLEADSEPPLADYGVTLSGSQATGPTMPAIELENVTPWEALAILHQHSAGLGIPYIPRMSYAKVFDMYEAGTYAAPSSITVTNKKALNDVRVRKTREFHYNRVVLMFGPSAVIARSDSFTGDGAEDEFTLTYPMLGRGQGYVTVNGVRESLGGTGAGTTWEYEPTTKVLTRTAGAPANLATIALTYGVQYPQTVTANDVTDQGGPDGVITKRFREEGIVNMATALNYVASKLEMGVEPSTIVTLTTREPLVFAGMSADIEIPDRDVDDTFLINELNVRTSGHLIGQRTIRAQAGVQFQGTYRETYKAWSSGGGSRRSSSVIGPNTYTDFGGDTDGGGTPPAGAPYQIQFNEAFRFGARFGAQFLPINDASVALGTPAAPTVADQGSGSYAATLRHYAIVWEIYDGAVLTAYSGMGAAAAFTPVGTGLAARITRPSPPATATHWYVVVSDDGGTTWYYLSPDTPVATTFYDDTTILADYPDGGEATNATAEGATTMAQMLLTTLSNVPKDSLQKWRSPNDDGVVSLTPWEAGYPGEFLLGGEMVNGVYIARSESVLFLSLQADGGGLGSSAGFAVLALYANQAIGSPVDFSDFVQLDLNFDASLAAGGLGNLSGSAVPSVFSADRMGLRDQLGVGSFKAYITFAGTHTDNTKEFRVQLGNATRTLRFDGVGTPVTFT